MKAMLAAVWERSMMRTMLHMPKPGVAWLVAVMLMNTLSLIIDAIDVVRYARGERAPTIILPE